ncbi:MAG: succinate dehydrogenase cytochrome b subunit [Bdellovibrionales bacterium]|nr:succinate dehydrogenase cytochrome b subunit [Bdellovibrionales bacterium]
MVTSAVNHYFRSSIGRKQLVAVTGLLLCGFLVSHLTGNFLLMVSSDAFNIYAHNLAKLGGLLYIIEAVLALIFLVHLGLAAKLSLENYQSRGKYQQRKKTGRGTTFASQTMPFTGVILLVFLILHLLNLKFGSHYEVTIDGVLMRDLTRTTMEYFRSPIATGWYVIAMAVAALHTSHGFASAFQSMGWNHGKYFKNVKRLGYIYAIAVGGGFAFLAIWCHLKGV